MSDWASEAGHWYDAATGEPRYTIIGKNGVERNTNLGDAKRAKARGEIWVPGATTITGIPRKPQLEDWKAEQLLMAGITQPQRDGETHTDWMKRLRKDADAQRDQAAKRGTEIHAAVEAYYAGTFYEDRHIPWIDSVTNLIKQEFGDDQTWRPEKSFASPLGYGGKVDLHSDSVLLDFKGKEAKNGVRDWRTYDEHAMQLAAYECGLQKYPPRTCAIIFFDRDEPYSELHLIKPADLERGWTMFRALLAYWKSLNRYE